METPFYPIEPEIRRFVPDVLTLPAAVGLTARFADDIVTLTKQDQTNYEERLHRRKRITTIENPVCFPQKLTKEREKPLITVGRLTPIKGTDLLAGIIPEVQEQCKDWK